MPHDPAIPVSLSLTPHLVAMAREQIIARALRLAEGRQSPVLLLSGGVDSATLLFALLEAGLSPRCVTFQVGDRLSTDVKVASRMTSRFGLRHQIVYIDPLALRQDVERILQLVDWSGVTRLKKTIIQCVHPFLYLCPQLDDDLALNGLQGDAFFLTRRSEAVAIHKHGDEHVWDWRRSFSADPDYSDFHIADVSARSFGVRLRDIYDWPWWAWWIQHFSPTLTNKPVIKYAAVALFEEFWRRAAWYRPPDRFQIGSGLRDLHDTLLTGTHHRAVIGYYHQVAKELGIQVGTHLLARDEKGRLLNQDGTIYGWPDADPYLECTRISMNKEPTNP